MVEETKTIILAKERCDRDCRSTSTPHFVKKVHNKHLLIIFSSELNMMHWNVVVRLFVVAILYWLE